MQYGVQIEMEIRKKRAHVEILAPVNGETIPWVREHEGKNEWIMQEGDFSCSI